MNANVGLSVCLSVCLSVGLSVAKYIAKLKILKIHSIFKLEAPDFAW